MKPPSTAQATEKKEHESAIANPSFDVTLLDILACPITKTELEYDENAQELISHAAELAFPIREGIPILLREEARAISTKSGTKG